MRRSSILFLLFTCLLLLRANAQVNLVKVEGQKKIDIFIAGKLFTSFLYFDSLEKPTLYPIAASNGTIVTRGFPSNTKPGDPTDHPHHLGFWMNYENVNGLDFWNNSYAIPKEKKAQYGWIKTDKIIETKNGEKGILKYHANWVNQANKILLQENTTLEFKAVGHKYIIDRTTTLTADTLVLFKDAKDGFLGFRAAHELQIQTMQDQKFSDDKGNVTIVKGGADKIPTGNYITSTGKQGDSVWSTRASWCKMFGKMGTDSISIVIFDHPKNPNYPTFWHARGYGLFAANPLGEKVFTNGKSQKNLTLKKGESVIFRYRFLVDNGKNAISKQNIEKFEKEFIEKK